KVKGSRSQGPGRGQSPSRISEKWFSVTIVALVLVVQATVLAPELRTAHVQNNDYINHITLTEQMVHEVERGGNPLDFWSPEISMGVPMARTYQPLAHLLAVACYFALGKSVAVVTVLDCVNFACILLLPLSFYACMRLLEF